MNLDRGPTQTIGGAKLRTIEARQTILIELGWCASGHDGPGHYEDVPGPRLHDRSQLSP